MNAVRPKICSIGRITSGLSKSQHLSSLVDFVYQTLPVWRDDPARPDAVRETTLNETLCGMLCIRAKAEIPCFYFTHEAAATGKRSVDMAVKPNEGYALDARSYTKYDTVLAIECKRLPAPTGDREREYVTGGDRITGGIQRFKLSEHGAGLPVAVMVGYIQRETAQTWFEKINGWLVELAGSTPADDGLQWENGEELKAFRYDNKPATARSISLHPRVSGKAKQRDKPVEIRHLWVEMTRRATCGERV